MIKVALDISPTLNLNKDRGIGKYTSNLVTELKKSKDINLELFEDKPKRTPDIVHFPYFDLYFPTLKIIKGVKNVITVHDTIPLIFPDKFPSGIRGKINLLRQKHVLKKVDAIICDSKTSKSDTHKYLGVPEEKIQVVYLAAANVFREINVNEINVVNRKLKMPKDYYVYVGNLNWNKNTNNLLKAVKITNSNLVIVGGAFKNENLSENANLKSLIKNLNLEKKVFLTGLISDLDLAAVYSGARATIVPSFYEGFGFPIVESMSCRTPVICSKTSSLSEIADEHAIYFDPENPEDIAQKIKEFEKYSKQKIESLSNESEKQASKFTWKKTADRTIEIYRSLLN